MIHKVDERPVEVRLGEQRWKIVDRQELAFGRDVSCELRIAHAPEDVVVSRRSGVVMLVAGAVVVRNESRLRLHLLPRPGPRSEILPGATAGVRAPYVTLLVLGKHNRRYEIHIDQRPVENAERGPAREVRGKVTETGPDLTAAQRKLLAALSEPLLTLAGKDASYVSTKYAAERLQLSIGSVNNRLLEIRRRLNDWGVPGLDGPTIAGALAMWAISAGVITSANLKELDN